MSNLLLAIKFFDNILYQINQQKQNFMLKSNLLVFRSCFYNAQTCNIRLELVKIQKKTSSKKYTKKINNIILFTLIFKILKKMINTEIKTQHRYCNCKQSKCMKLYCECLSSRVPCGKSCRCIGCQNSSLRQIYQQKNTYDKKISKQQIIKMHKGCSCRRSNCNKKYCDCFQSGILCRDTCKCIDCQNNQSLTNRRIINQLRKNNSEISNNQTTINLYPLNISQNSQHLQSIIVQSNPLGLEQNWFQNCAKILYAQALKGSEVAVMDKFLSILTNLQDNLIQQLKYKNQQFSENIQQQNNSQQNQNKKQQNLNRQLQIHLKNQQENIQRGNQNLQFQDIQNNKKSL